jgi:hypothetical protein
MGVVGRAAKAHPAIAMGLAGLAALPAGHAEGRDLPFRGVLAGRAIGIEGQPTWLRGGFGRLTEGAGGPADREVTARAEAHLGLEWRPTETWLVQAHGVFHGEPADYGGTRAGLVEAFVQYRPELTPTVALRLKAGLFFPQTSLETSDPLWQSPYTLTLSALNAWIAEEVRPAGLDAAVVVRTGTDGRAELAAGLVGATDTAGTLLAWRGWTLGDRLSGVGEVLPLPPLPSLGEGGGFAKQREGTRPVDELDGRPGWQARVRGGRPGRFEVRAAYLDNRGDRALHRGQYAWRTSFVTAGLELHLGPQWTLLAEGAAGDTGMGVVEPDRPHVEMGFRAGYALLSWGSGPWRLSGRLDAFRNVDHDGTEEANQEDGWAWTAALLWSPSVHWRVGAEYLDLRAQRPAAAPVASADTDGRRAVIEVRVRF